MHVANKLVIQRRASASAGGVAADGDSSSKRTSQTPRRFTHPELLLQQRAACRVGREDAVDITVQLPGGHLCLSAHDGLHQSVVDENILLLRAARQRLRL